MMRAVRTKYDGESILVPADVRSLPPCNVIVLFEDEQSRVDAGWIKIQEQAMASAWDDKEDGVYDEA